MFLAIAMLLASSSGQQVDFFRTYSGPGGNEDSVTCTHIGRDGTRYFGGNQFTDSESKFDFFLQAFTPTGELKWRKVYGPQRGGDKIPGFSERYWRSDIPDCISSDKAGNIFIAGFSTFGPKDEQFGTAIVSYTATGEFRFATKIKDWSAGPTPMAVGNDGTVWIVGQAGVKESRRLRRDHGYPVHLVMIDQKGRIKKTINLGTDLKPNDMRLLPSGNIAVLVAHVGKLWEKDGVDEYTHYLYNRGGPSTTSKWLRFEFDPSGKQVSKQEIDPRKGRMRGTGRLLPSGGCLTIDGHEDGTDRLTCRDPKGAVKWTIELERSISKAGGEGTRYHYRLSTSFAVNDTHVFIASDRFPVPAEWKRNRGPQIRWGWVIQVLDMNTGQPGPTYDYDTNAAPFGLYSIAASSDAIIMGGSIRNDACMVSWTLK